MIIYVFEHRGKKFGFFFSSRRRHTRCGRDWSSDVCSSDLAYAQPAQVSAAVHRVITERFGLDVAVVVRTAEQLAGVLAWNPFPDAAANRPQLVHVLHLAATPDPERVRDLLAADVTPDQLAARGAEVVVAYAKSSQRTPTEGPLRRLGD